MSETTRPVTMWAANCPFRKTGSPVLGSMGATIRPVVLFEMAEWNRLCEEVPQRGHDAGSHNTLRFNCLATRDGTHATRCACKHFAARTI